MYTWWVNPPVHLCGSKRMRHDPSHPTRGEHAASRTSAAKPARPSRQTKTATLHTKTRTSAVAGSHTGTRIEQVHAVLGEVLQWQYPADATLSRWFKTHPHLGARDRSEVANAVFDVLRHLRRYRQFAQSGSGPAARRLAVLGLAGSLPTGRTEDGAEPAARHADAAASSTLPEAFLQALDAKERDWLAQVRRIDLASLPLAVRFSLPDWLAQEIQTLDDAPALMHALNLPAPLDVRVNPYKTQREAVLAQLQGEAFAACQAQATPYSPWGIRLQGHPPLNRWTLFSQGLIEVQDEGSQLLALLLAPKRGEMVIDYCAGAGGKTLLLGALMRSTGRLYAFEVSRARLARAKPRFARSGLSNIHPVVIARGHDARVARLYGKAHRVLVDAPCSGVGTLRRNPDLKWRAHPESVRELTQLQAQILDQAARCVRPGGYLVYATCSLLPQENEVQVQQFLATHPEFELCNAAQALQDRCPDLGLADDYLRLRPDVHGTDGFFAALMQRA